MRKIILKSFVVCLLLYCGVGYECHAQTDTLRVMAYNVLDYGSLPLCQGPNGIYNAYLETIVQYAHPDIISLEKMASLQTSPSDHNYSGKVGFQDSILQYALNAAFPGRYNSCPFTNYAASTYEDMLFYNQQKLGFIDIVCSYSNTEDFNTYKLYYLDPNLATTHDTTYLYATLNHDISGSTMQTERGGQISGEMSVIQDHFTHLANMINMGDFNVRNTSEPVYQTLTAPPDTNFRYYDPPFFPDASLSYPANWDALPLTYSAYMTTSTRSTAGVPNSCGVGGGGKDWYDHIFLSPWIINNANYISYIPHSYTTLGNDGHRLSISVNDAPANSAVPAAVANALYGMSDKYPVMVDLLVTQNTTGISPPDPEITPAAVINRSSQKEYATVANPAQNNIALHFSNGLIGQTVSFDCVDMLGRLQMHQSVMIDKETMELPCNLNPGIYAVRIAGDHGVISQVLLTKY